MLNEKKEVLMNIVEVLETGSEVIHAIDLEIKNVNLDKVANFVNDLCLMYDSIIRSLQALQYDINMEKFLEYSIYFEESLKEIIDIFEEGKTTEFINNERIYIKLSSAYYNWKSNIQYEVIQKLTDNVINNLMGTDQNNKLTNAKNKVLIGSPIHQKPHILNEFLLSISRLNEKGLDITLLFIDDNNNEESSELLRKLSVSREKVIIYKSEDKESYVCDNETHRWRESLIWKVADFKNMMIKVALENNFDYLFLIDSDIVLHPNTLEHLISTEKDIISEVFWTKWKPNMPELPQVWLWDQYGLFNMNRGEKITENEMLIRQQNFISQLRKPGIYEVGGLGACTLISREALIKGVNFDVIKNLSFWGEDRHFCVRAAALGIDLYVDTNYPAYHIYRETDLGEGLDKYKKECQDFSPTNNLNLFPLITNS
ncbi:hypothetical protein M3172_13020 [Mesobacillus subterraneus]|uniref:glycosyltransferase family 2 protein n=1 Tax=Mesobacillus subterraneus TaxID=285983 RepID=UPI00203B72DC|nr:hypothetical protein [Mesobacillus subterraneus]MCM3574110.1 hypothetical protein [Mesobacillus subterraneus]